MARNSPDACDKHCADADSIAAEPFSRAHDGPIARWLFAFLVCFYILVGGGHIYTPDGVVMFHVSQSIISGRLDVPALTAWRKFGVHPGKADEAGNRRLYAKFGLGQSLVAAPLVALGSAIGRIVPDAERSIFETARPASRMKWDDWSADNWPVPLEIFLASFLNAFVAAGSVALLFLLGRELGFRRGASLAMGFLAGLATPLTHYAQTFFSEPLAGFCFLTGVYCMQRASRKSWHIPSLLTAGAALGFISLTKVALSVLWLPAGAYLALLLWHFSRTQDLNGMARIAVCIRRGWPVAAGLIPALVALCTYNILRFGSIFETGYGSEAHWWSTRFSEGFFGLLFSPGRGLFWYMPLAWAALLMARPFARYYPKEAVLCLCSLCALLVLYARWHLWDGGWCWGPRFLIPVVPLVLLPVGAGLRSFARWSRFKKAWFSILVVISVLVTINGLLVNYVDFYGWLWRFFRVNADAFRQAGIASFDELLRWHWQYSPLVAYWRFPTKDYFMLSHAFAPSGILLLTYGLAGAFLAGAGTMLVRHFLRAQRAEGA